MGMFDNALKNAVPGGDLATPIAIAAGALILGKLFGGSSAPASAPAPRAPAPAPSGGGLGGALGGALGGGALAGGLLGGLTDLVGKLSAGGALPQVNSWVGTGQNLPINPGQLASALGQQTISELAQKSGLNEQDLINQLSLVLPQLVNHLTPNGRLPTAAELGQ